MERRNAWLSYTEAEEKELEQVAKAYRNFLNVGKTEKHGQQVMNLWKRRLRRVRN